MLLFFSFNILVMDLHLLEMMLVLLLEMVFVFLINTFEFPNGNGRHAPSVIVIVLIIVIKVTSWLPRSMIVLLPVWLLSALRSSKKQITFARLHHIAQDTHLSLKCLLFG